MALILNNLVPAYWHAGKMDPGDDLNHWPQAIHG